MDLKTTYLGLSLNNPVVPSASPLTQTLDGMKRLEDAGAGAVVMHSLFEEQITHEAAELEHYLSYGTESFAESLTYFPNSAEYKTGPDEYVELVHKAASSLKIPVIASLNGITNGGWTSYAKKLQQAGAHAIELNVYYIPTDYRLSGTDVEDRYLEVLKAVKQAVTIPVAMKMSPFFSAFANMAHRLDAAGADGLVLFNRFYQPDIDLEAMEVKPGVTLSSSFAMRVPMRWIAILRGKVKASLAATSGIHTAEDVVKALLVGADVTMMCSALLKHGPAHVEAVVNDLKRWMTEREYSSVQQLKGSMSQQSVADPSAFERANYMKALSRYQIGSF